MIKRCIAAFVLTFAFATAAGADCPLIKVVKGEFSFTRYACFRVAIIGNECVYSCSVL